VAYARGRTVQRRALELTGMQASRNQTTWRPFGQIIQTERYGYV
jgi:hypothetical protein